GIATSDSAADRILHPIYLETSATWLVNSGQQWREPGIRAELGQRRRSQRHQAGFSIRNRGVGQLVDGLVGQVVRFEEVAELSAHQIARKFAVEEERDGPRRRQQDCFRPKEQHAAPAELYEAH